MTTTDNERHTRICLMLMNGGEKISEALFEKCVKEQTSANHDPYPWRLNQFLEANKKKILGTQTGRAKKSILFPPENTCTSVEEWDLYLYCYFLTEICVVKPTVRMDAKELRKMRNKLCHSKEPKIDKEKYNRKVEKLEVIFERLLDEISDEDLKKEVDNIVKKSKKDPLCHEETILLMHRFYAMDSETQEILNRQSTDIKSLIEQVSELKEKQDLMLKHMLTDSKMDNCSETCMELRVKNCNLITEKNVSNILVDMYKKATGQETSDHCDLSEENYKEMMAAVLDTVANFASKGRVIIDAKQKCVVLLIKCTSVSSLLSLYNDCINGDLNREFRQLELAVRNVEGLEEVSLEAVIYEYEFYRTIQRTVSAIDEVVSKTHVMQVKSCAERETQKTYGVSDVRLVERRFPGSDDNGRSQHAVRLRLNTDHEGKTQLIKSIQSGSFDSSINHLTEEICKHYNLTNLTIEAKLLKEGYDVCTELKSGEDKEYSKNDESSTTECKIDDKSHKACQGYTRIIEDNVSNSCRESLFEETSANTPPNCAIAETSSNGNNMNSSAYFTSCGLSSIKTVVVESETSKQDCYIETEKVIATGKQNENTMEIDMQPNIGSDIEEDERDLKEQTEGNKCSINELIKSSFKEMQNENFLSAKKMVQEAMLNIDKEKDILIANEKTVTTEFQLIKWYRKCFHIFSLLRENVYATRCYYTAMVFDPNWDYDEHLYLSDLLWQKLVFCRWNVTVHDLHQEMEPLLDELYELATLAEKKSKWSVCLAIDSDVDAIYYFLNMLKRIRMINFDKDQPKRKDAFKRMARCFLKMGLHQDARKLCITLLQDFCEYDDSEALQIWSQSLFVTEDFELALQKNELAIKYCKDDLRLEELKNESIHIQKKVEEKQLPRTNKPDNDWLKGTNASLCHAPIILTGKQKRRHKRPKSRTKPELDLPINSLPVTKENQNIDRHKVHYSEVKSKSLETVSKQNMKHNLQSGYSSAIGSKESSLSKFEVTGQDQQFGGSEIINASDITLNVSQDGSFYDRSIHELQSKQNETTIGTFLKNGVKLHASYLKQFIDTHPEVLHREQFYADLIPKSKLKKMVSSSPEKYKKCVIHFETSHQAYCKPLDSNSNFVTIEVSGRSKIGCEIFNEDEVVVEIIDSLNTSEKRHGKVLGVLNRKRHEEISHPVFLCTLDEMESHLVKPMCKTVPKIHILTKEISKKYKTKKERALKLEVYDYDEAKGLFCNPQITEINPADQESYILVVAYIHWGTRHIYPRGAVIRILSGVKDFARGIQVLNLQYEIPDIYREETVEEVKRIMQNNEGFDRNSHCGRTDLTKETIFTVAKAGIEELNYAFSIDDVENGFKIGLHVSDVSAIVTKDSPIDIEAYQRATTFSPEFGQKRHMLPEPLSEGLCNIQPGKIRLAISVFLFVSDSGRIMQMQDSNFKVMPSYIQSKRHFTDEYEQNNSDSKDEAWTSFKKLLKISYKLRQNRLDYTAVESKDKVLDVGMTDEILIMANKKISQFLLIHDKNHCVPLLYSPEPTKDAIQDFLRKSGMYKDVIHQWQKECIGHRKSDYNEIIGKKTDQQIILSDQVWQSILESPKTAAKYIQNDDLHPIQLVTAFAWREIQKEKEYAPSGVLKQQGFYTSFTSPIHSYMDLIVQRLIHIEIVHTTKRLYSVDDMTRICIHINSMRLKERQYMKACHLLNIATELRQTPVMINAIVKDTTDRGISLCSTLFKGTSKPEIDMAFNLLDVAEKPLVTQDKFTNWDKVETVWKKRLYDIHVHAIKPDCEEQNLKLKPHKDIVFIPLHEWAKLLKCSIEDRNEDLSRAIKHVNVSHDSDGLDDVTTECFATLDLQTYTKFSMTFSRGQSVRVQVSAEAKRGLLSPKITLYNMTENVKLCLQHQENPVSNLYRYALRTSSDKYKNVNEYLEKWVPILLMESSTGAVKNEENFCINNVPIQFTGRHGMFALNLPDCEARNIEFSGTVSDDEDSCDLEDGVPCYDWLCLKTMVPANTTRIKGTQVYGHYWVGHAQITKVTLTKNASPNGKIVVNFTLHHTAPDLPSFCRSDKQVIFGIEVLRKLEVDRRTERFIKMLPSMNETLAAKIAVNKPIPDLDANRRHFGRLIERDLYYDCSGEDLRRKPLPKNNREQQSAIDKALDLRFTLIQGPPGTGKTNTGIKLIYLFNKINDIVAKEGSSKKQVLFCGPSNKSVDLVAVWMLNRMGNFRPNFVRVYGRSIETIDFPVPGRTYQSRRSTKTQRASPALYPVSLHHLIRQRGKKYAEEINKMDALFERRNYAPMPVEVKKYVHLVREASIDEIRKHDVILCTTAVGSNPKFLSATSVYQVVVDEAGMCPEPQCLVPIIATKAEQVVLIGDHKQLRPVIMCKEAAALGLETSLFERYAKTIRTKSSKNVGFTMLQKQYRMHQNICTFPSIQFYDGELQTKQTHFQNYNSLNIWPKDGDESYPFVFIHVEGHEDMLTVSTEDGNEQSRSNAAEIDQVVKVYTYLTKMVNQHKESIHIISQYNAQCSEIRKRLQSKGVDSEQVSTVVSSQGGEWDYVIFSTVRSLPDYKIEKNSTIGWCQHNLGFITDKNQINVAITRARKGLIIIGNKNLLKCDQVWKKMIEHYDNFGCIKSKEEFPPSSDQPKFQRENSKTMRSNSQSVMRSSIMGKNRQQTRRK